MKKAYLSPMTSFLVSLSLALGILVSDLSGYRLLTSAHAQEGSPCGGQENDVTVVSDMANIEDGLILNGITVSNVTVNGSVHDHAVIDGSVHISDATVVGSTYNGGGLDAGPGGVIVGVDAPCSSGVIVGVDTPAPTGVIVGVDTPAPTGVIVGVDSPILSGVTGTVNGAAIGGALTGDNITITGGVITGQNLLLSGATFNSGSISGTITSIRITPSN